MTKLINSLVAIIFTVCVASATFAEAQILEVTPYGVKPVTAAEVLPFRVYTHTSEAFESTFMSLALPIGMKLKGEEWLMKQQVAATAGRKELSAAMITKEVTNDQARIVWWPLADRTVFPGSFFGIEDDEKDELFRLDYTWDGPNSKWNVIWNRHQAKNPNNKASEIALFTGVGNLVAMGWAYRPESEEKWNIFHRRLLNPVTRKFEFATDVEAGKVYTALAKEDHWGDFVGVTVNGRVELWRIATTTVLPYHFFSASEVAEKGNFYFGADQNNAGVWLKTNDSQAVIREASFNRSLYWSSNGWTYVKPDRYVEVQRGPSRPAVAQNGFARLSNGSGYTPMTYGPEYLNLVYILGLGQNR